MNADASTLLDMIVSGGVFSTIASVVTWLLSRPKTRADMSDVVAGRMLQMVDPLERRLAAADEKIDELIAKLDQANARADAEHAGRNRAEGILRQHNLPVPPFIPPPHLA